ncbi:hypothetical protein D3C84_789760 [compost metagenome]
MEGVEHQQGVLELLGSGVGQLGIVQQLDQGGDVVAALHGAQQLDGAGLAQQRGDGFALGDGGQEAGLDVGGLVDARRNAVGDQVDQHLFFASRRILQQLDQRGGLLGVQGQWRQALLGAFFQVLAITCEQGDISSHVDEGRARGALPARRQAAGGKQWAKKGEQYRESEGDQPLSRYGSHKRCFSAAPGPARRAARRRCTRHSGG